MGEMGVRHGRKFQEGGDICMHIADSGLPRWLSSKESACQLKETKEMWVQSLGWEDPLEEEMAVHSSILAGRISWTEEPGRLQSMGLQRAEHD